MFDIKEEKIYKDLPSEMVEEIASLYRKNIHVPFQKPEKQFLLCPVGLIGSGKTTVVRPLSEQLDLVRISNDEIRKMLKDRGYNYDKLRDIGQIILDEFLKNGYSIALDANCGSRNTRQTIEKITIEYGLEPVWIHINPPEEFIIKKLNTFNHSWLFENGDGAVKAYQAYKTQYDDSIHPNIPFLYVFDTSKENLPQQINEAEKLIRNKLNL